MKDATILIVEDEVLIAKSLENLLRKAGYTRITTATKGEEAIAKATDNRPDVLLVDINLKSKVNGIQIARRIGKDFSAQIIYLTAYTDEETISRAKLTEPFAFLSKPYNERDVLINIEMALYKGEMERRLKESEGKYRRIVELANEGIIAVDADVMITFVNRRLLEILGYTEQEMVGRPGRDFIFPGDRAAHRQHMALRKESRAGAYEQKFRRKDGSPCWLYVSATPITDEKGIFAGSFGMVTDITERKRSEEEKQRLLAAIEHTDEAIFITDEKGIIQFANFANELRSGFPRDKMLGVNLFFPKTSSYDDAFFKDIWNTVSSGNIWKSSLVHKHKNGSFYNYATVITPVKNAEGKIINYVSISRDVTREVQLEEQLLQSQKMEAMGTLAGGIAHDFNNILGGLYNYTELARDAVSSESPAHDYLAEAQKLIERAADLVKQILAFSRKEIPERKPVRISAVVAEVMKMLRASLPATIDIVLALEDQTGDVLSDPTQINQVLVNLCTNAAYAMREKGGQLRIGLAAVAVQPDDVLLLPDVKPGPYLQLTVSDTGTGISPDIIKRIFEPFFTTKEKGRGTGMGLAVAHGIAKSHGGTITVESRIGKGSTFTVLLPRIADEKQEKPSGEEETIPGGTESVLFLDDEEFLADSGKRILTSLGYKVTALQSSAEALKVFAQNPEAFDLVITDQTMPHMTGYELAQKLMNIRKDIPVILCTGYSEAVSEEQAQSIGIKGFVLKPIRKRKIAEMIRTVLGGKE